jgi:hypothetical protein
VIRNGKKRIKLNQTFDAYEHEIPKENMGCVHPVQFEMFVACIREKRFPTDEEYTKPPKTIYLDALFTNEIYIIDALFTNEIYIRLTSYVETNFDYLGVRFANKSKPSNQEEDNNASPEIISIADVEHFGSRHKSYRFTKEQEKEGEYGLYFKPPVEITNTIDLYLKITLKDKPKTDNTLKVYVSLKHKDGYIPYEIIFKKR